MMRRCGKETEVCKQGWKAQWHKYNHYLSKNKTPFEIKRGLIIRFGDANASEFSKGESQVYMEAGILKCR